MPIRIYSPVRPMGRQEFAEIAYQVVKVAFDVHAEFGRIFDEPVYKREIARRLSEAKAEVKIEVTYQDFLKEYYMDLLVSTGALFELKTVKCLAEDHESQGIHYMLLAGLHHCKIINMRPEKVEHWFVNTPLTRQIRISFQVNSRGWIPVTPACEAMKDMTIDMLRDWGTGLRANLYKEAFSHFFCGGKDWLRPVRVLSNGRAIGTHKMCLLTPDTALEVTAFNDQLEIYAEHLWRLLRHTELENIQWINVGLNEVVFKTIRNKE